MCDRFAVCKAFWLYSVIWGHDEFTRRIQTRLDAINYHPGGGGHSLRDLCTDPNARRSYLRLVRSRQGSKAARKDAAQIFGHAVSTGTEYVRG